MASSPASDSVIYEAETPDGALTIESSEDGLTFVARSNELVGRKKFITESVVWFQAQLKQWLQKNESRNNNFQLTFREPPAVEGMIAAPRVPPTIMLSYAEAVDMERAIRDWTAGRASKARRKSSR